MMDEFNLIKHTAMGAWPGTIVLVVSIYLVAQSSVDKRAIFLSGLLVLLALNLLGLAFTQWLFVEFPDWMASGPDALSLSGLFLVIPHALAIGLCVCAFIRSKNVS